MLTKCMQPLLSLDFAALVSKGRPGQARGGLGAYLRSHVVGLMRSESKYLSILVCSKHYSLFDRRGLPRVAKASISYKGSITFGYRLEEGNYLHRSTP